MVVDQRGGVGKDRDAAAAGGSLTEAAWVAAAPASPARAPFPSRAFAGLAWALAFATAFWVAVAALTWWLT